MTGLPPPDLASVRLFARSSVYALFSKIYHSYMSRGSVYLLFIHGKHWPSMHLLRGVYTRNKVGEGISSFGIDGITTCLLARLISILLRWCLRPPVTVWWTGDRRSSFYFRGQCGGLWFRQTNWWICYQAVDLIPVLDIYNNLQVSYFRCRGCKESRSLAFAILGS